MASEGCGHCPTCGRFVGQIVAHCNDESLVSVSGACSACGPVDLSDQPWAWEDFYPEPIGARDGT